MLGSLIDNAPWTRRRVSPARPGHVTARAEGDGLLLRSGGLRSRVWSRSTPTPCSSGLVDEAGRSARAGRRARARPAGRGARGGGTLELAAAEGGAVFTVALPLGAVLASHRAGTSPPRGDATTADAVTPDAVPPDAATTFPKRTP